MWVYCWLSQRGQEICRGQLKNYKWKTLFKLFVFCNRIFCALETEQGSKSKYLQIGKLWSVAKRAMLVLKCYRLCSNRETSNNVATFSKVNPKKKRHFPRNIDINGQKTNMDKKRFFHNDLKTNTWFSQKCWYLQR